MRSKSASTIIGVPTNHNLSITTAVVSKQFYRLNFKGEIPMYKYRIKATFTNTTDGVYYIKMPKWGYIGATRKNRINDPDIYVGGNSWNIDFEHPKVSTRLNAGESRDFYAFCDDSSGNYYPIDLKTYEEYLEFDSTAWEPRFVLIPYFFVYYNQKKIKEINHQLAIALQKQNNNTNANQQMDDLISELEEETEPATDITIVNTTIEKESEIVFKTVDESNNKEKLANYDATLCNSLKTKANYLLQKINGLKNSANGMELQQQLFSEIKNYQIMISEGVANKKLDPDCIDVLNDIMEGYAKKELAKAEQLINNFDVNNAAPKTKVDTTPLFAPSTMTSTYKKKTPSLKPTKFSKGKLQKGKHKDIHTNTKKN